MKLCTFKKVEKPPRGFGSVCAFLSWGELGGKSLNCKPQSQLCFPGWS